MSFSLFVLVHSVYCLEYNHRSNDLRSVGQSPSQYNIVYLVRGRGRVLPSVLSLCSGKVRSHTFGNVKFLTDCHRNWQVSSVPIEINS